MDPNFSYLKNIQIREHNIKNEENQKNNEPHKVIVGGCPICVMGGDKSEYIGQIKHLSVPIGLVVFKYNNKCSMKNLKLPINNEIIKDPETNYDEDEENNSNDVISDEKFNLLFEKCMLKSNKMNMKKSKKYILKKDNTKKITKKRTN